jgi:hypothetical protein
MRCVALFVVSSTLAVAGCGSKDAVPQPPATAAPAVAEAAPPVTATQGVKAFKQTLELYGVSFQLDCPNDSNVNTLQIQPAGLEVDNSGITRQVNGIVTGAEVADLDANGSPEIYVYVSSADDHAYGSVVGYAANKRKSLSEIYLPPIEPGSDSLKGYRGHDEFTVVESSLVRRFPLYRDGAAGPERTGGVRQFQYKLTPGEANWLLRLDRTVDY